MNAKFRQTVGVRVIQFENILEGKRMMAIKDLHVRLTTECNLECAHCYAAGWSQYKYTLEYELVKRIIKEAIELGCKSVTFSGGEPFLHPQIYDLLHFCQEQGIYTNVESNGTLIEIDMLTSSIGKDLLKLKISYDGNTLRGGDSNIVTENIKALKKKGYNLLIQTVITKLNVNEIDSLLLFSQENKVEHRLFLGHSKSGSGVNIPNFMVEEVLKIKEEILKKYPYVIIELPKLISGKEQKGCGWGISRCEIMPNGDVTSCAPLTYSRADFVAGNIRELSLKELWESKHFTQIREIKQSQYKGVCSVCKYFSECRGSCRSVSASIGGEILSSYPYCEQYVNCLHNN